MVSGPSWSEVLAAGPSFSTEPSLQVREIRSALSGGPTFSVVLGVRIGPIRAGRAALHISNADEHCTE